MNLLCLALCFSGFGALCMGQERHHEQIFGHRPSRYRAHVLSVLGWLLLAIATLPAIHDLGASIGLSLWAAALTLAALAQMLLLSYRPRLVVAANTLAPLLALPALVLLR